MKNCFVPVFFVAVLALTIGCTKNTPDTSSLYIPGNSDVTANATLLELQQGRTLYVNSCGNCHGLYSPDIYTPTQWKSVLGTMAPRAGLSSAEIQLVTKYVSRGKQ